MESLLTCFLGVSLVSQLVCPVVYEEGQCTWHGRMTDGMRDPWRAGNGGMVGGVLRGVSVCRVCPGIGSPSVCSSHTGHLSIWEVRLKRLGLPPRVSAFSVLPSHFSPHLLGLVWVSFLCSLVCSCWDPRRVALPPGVA